MVLSTSSLHASAYRITNGGVPEITYILKPKWESQCVRRSEDLALHIMLRFAYSSFVCVLAHSNPVPSAASVTAPTSPDFGSNSNTDDDDNTFDLCLPCSFFFFFFFFELFLLHMYYCTDRRRYTNLSNPCTYAREPLDIPIGIPCYCYRHLTVS